MDKWEYLIVEIEFEKSKELDEKIRQEAERLGKSNFYHPSDIARQMGLPLTRKARYFDEFGRQGWELVIIRDGDAYFKRKIE